MIVVLFALLNLLTVSDTQIADAIYKTEGGSKAAKPFGILSVPCEGYDECRVICLNTIRNNRKRFKKQTKYVDFIEFLGSRYAPVEAHPLNKNWVKNVKWFLKEERKERK